VNDTELYAQILGLAAPWFVAKVDLTLAAGRVEVFVEHVAGQTFACPDCARMLPVYDHSDRRTWRHLDTCQYQTLLHAAPPRVQCPEHGVRQAALPWAAPRSRFTLLFERFARSVLAQTSVAGAAKLLGLSRDEVFGLMERAVRPRRAAVATRPWRLLGVDEKAWARGQRYVTIVYDLERGTAIWTGPARTADTLAQFYATLTDAQKAGIAGVAMDLWVGFRSATVAALPDGATKVVFDRFHVMQRVNDAVDTVRRRENTRLRRADDERLTGTRYVWLYARDALPAKYEATLQALATTDLETVRAWRLKESLRQLWSASSARVAQRFHRWWDRAARASGLQAMVKVAQSIADHLDGILAYFTHRITNAAAEGINSGVQVVKSRARGFRNLNHFQTAVLFYCGDDGATAPQRN
jgi:transposase